MDYSYVTLLGNEMITKTITVLFLLASTVHFSLGQTIQKDTSYTVNSAFLKYSKKFPNISIAEAGASEISIQKDVAYSDVNGRKLNLDIYAPQQDSNKCPAIFMVHGGGWKSGDKSHMQALGSAFAANSYVAIAMEYRLSPEALYPTGILDIVTSIRWVLSQAAAFKIDTSKLVLMGCSSGAQMVSLIGMTAVERGLNIRSVVNLDGILAFRHPESGEGESAASWLGGTYYEASQNWDEASPLTHVGKGDPAILFINSQYPRFHAGRDDVIHILSEEGIYTESHELPDTPHTFWLFNPWFQPTIDYILTFLDKTM